MKFCRNCGTALEDGAKFCLNCGTQVEVKEEKKPEPEEIKAPAAYDEDKEPVYADEEDYEAPAPAPVKRPKPAVSAPSAPSYEDDDKEPVYADEDEDVPVSVSVPKQPKQPKQPSDVPAKLKKLPWKKIGIICAAVLLVAILIPILVSVLKRANPGITTVKSTIFANDYNGSSYVIKSGGKPVEIEGARSIRVYRDMKQEHALLRTTDDVSTKLYYFDGKDIQKIAEDDTFGTLLISQDGSTVLYEKLNSEDLTRDIYVWSKGKSEKIASGAYVSALSPDGKTVGYCRENEDGEKTGFIYDGKEKELGKNCVPFAVSNGAKYVYLARISDSGTNAYVQKGLKDGDRIKLTDGGSANRFIFNKDLSQAMYISDSGRTYLAVNGKDPDRVSTKPLEPMIHALVEKYDCSTSAASCYALGIKNFDGKLYRSNGSRVVYLKNNEVNEVRSDDDSVVWITDDGTDFIWYDRSGIYRSDAAKINPITASMYNPDTLYNNEKGIYRCLTIDGKTFFVWTNNSELVCVKGGKETKVENTDEVDSYGIIDGKLLYVKDGALYTSSGKTGARVKSFKYEVSSMDQLSADMILIYTREGAVLVTDDAKNFTVLYAPETDGE